MCDAPWPLRWSVSGVRSAAVEKAPLLVSAPAVGSLENPASSPSSRAASSAFCGVLSVQFYQTVGAILPRVVTISQPALQVVGVGARLLLQ